MKWISKSNLAQNLTAIINRAADIQRNTAKSIIPENGSRQRIYVMLLDDSQDHKALHTKMVLRKTNELKNGRQWRG